LTRFLAVKDFYPMSHSPSKKRGAQPANTNALKHGVYSRHYTPEELFALDRDVAGSLKDELEILRLAIFDAAESVLKEPEDSLSFHDNVTALRTITVAVARLENIVQVRMTAFGDPDRREKQVESMLALMEQSEMDATKDLEGETPISFVGAHIIPGGDIGPREELRSTLSPKVIEGIPKGPPLGGEGEYIAPIPSVSPPKKHSGAPLGNSNAYKHGFYSRAYTPSEKILLQGDEADQLRHEETLLRILLRRTWRSFRLVRPSLPWLEVHFTVRTIGYAVFVIAKLQRARRRFFGDKTDLEKDIQLGLSEACADLGILDYFQAQVNK
jgi:hypothetical protein